MMHENEELRREARVVAPDGPAGHVAHVIVDRSTNTVCEIVVQRGGRAWLVPFAAVGSIEGGVVHLRTGWSETPTETFDRHAFRDAQLDADTVLDTPRSATAVDTTPQVTHAEGLPPGASVVVERIPVRRENTNDPAVR